MLEQLKVRMMREKVSEGVSIGRRCLCCWRSILVTSRVHYNVMLHSLTKM